jgi:hypothetical protein
MARTTPTTEIGATPREDTSALPVCLNERLVDLSEEELAGLREIIENADASTEALLKAFAKPDRFTFKSSSRIW